MRSRSPILVAAAALLMAVATPRGQQAPTTPHVGYVYPAGGQRGTTFDVKVGGRFLDGVNGVIVSGGGVRAEVVGHDKPMNGQQITALREKVQELAKQGNTAAVQREVADARLRIGDSLRRNANPALAEIVALRVTVAADAESGARQIRLVTPAGLTNPLVFCVGQLPEVREKDEKRSRADAELPIALPAVVNGRLVPGDVDRLQFPLRQPQQYMPGDVDRYRFAARKGQNLVVVASARNLMPYLADAVPGWFQATVTLYDATGREVAYDDDYRFEPDPVLHYQVPQDGDYVVEIRDALYRGREDFVYRLAIGELPFVTSVFPLGGRVGARTGVALTGWNLGSDKVTVDGRRQEPGIHAVSAVGCGRDPQSCTYNGIDFKFDDLPEAFEREPNDSPKQAQQVTLPLVVNGRIDRPGDEDVFAFKGRAGDDIVAEVFARRLGSPLDSALELTDAAGRRLAFNDDAEDKSAGLLTHHADSLLTTRLPANGTYVLRLRDVQRKGGIEYGYRLRLSAPRPDYDLRIAPSGITVPGSGSAPISVYAIRKDGFAGDISLNVSGGGFRLSGGLIPSGQDQIRLTLTAPPTTTGEVVELRVEGRATITGKTVVRQAMPADEMMQAFAYVHLVPADRLRASVIARGATRVPLAVVSAQPVRLTPGATTRVRVALPPALLRFDKIQFELSDPPDGITLRESSVEATAGAPGAQFVLQADASKVKAGQRGNLIVTLSGERVPPAGNAQQQAPAQRRRVTLGTLPAIQFEVMGRS